MRIKLSKKEYRKLRIALLERDKWCQICGNPHGLEAHHIIYRSQGGSDTMENMVCLCFTCHALVHNGLIKINQKGEWGTTCINKSWNIDFSDV